MGALRRLGPQFCHESVLLDGLASTEFFPDFPLPWKLSVTRHHV